MSIWSPLSLRGSTITGPTSNARWQNGSVAATTNPRSCIVATTLPTKQITNFTAHDLEKTNNTIFELAKTQSAEQLIPFVERIGVPPVMKFGKWVDAHVRFAAGAGVELKWTPLSRPFFARNKLMPDRVLGLSFGGGDGSPPPAIPALESALGSHPCGALSSFQVPPL